MTSQYGAGEGVDLAETLVHRLGPVRRDAQRTRHVTPMAVSSAPRAAISTDAGSTFSQSLPGVPVARGVAQCHEFHLDITPSITNPEARRRGRRYALRPNSVVCARYDAGSESLVLTLRSGHLRIIPRQGVSELDAVPSRRLSRVTVSVAGDALSWREFDVDVSVVGLLRRSPQLR